MSIYTHNKRYAAAHPALRVLLFEPKLSLTEDTDGLRTQSFTLPLPNVHFKDKKSAVPEGPGSGVHTRFWLPSCFLTQYYRDNFMIIYVCIDRVC